jgi:hypothetical protein
MTQQLAPGQTRKNPDDEDRPVRTVTESQDSSAKSRPRQSKQVPDRPFLPGYYLG